MFSRSPPSLLVKAYLGNTGRRPLVVLTDQLQPDLLQLQF